MALLNLNQCLLLAVASGTLGLLPDVLGQARVRDWLLRGRISYEITPRTHGALAEGDPSEASERSRDAWFAGTRRLGSGFSADQEGYWNVMLVVISILICLIGMLFVIDVLLSLPHRLDEARDRGLHAFGVIILVLVSTLASTIALKLMTAVDFLSSGVANLLRLVYGHAGKAKTLAIMMLLSTLPLCWQ